MEQKHRQQFESRSSRAGDLDEQLVTSCQQFFEQKITFKPASRPDFYLKHLHSRYRPLNPTMPEQSMDTGEAEVQQATGEGQGKNNDGIPEPKRILFNPSQLEMKWTSSRSVGSGLANMGNTCFLNSVLQCLTYTPPLFNYLLSDHHKKICHTQGFCAMCELQRHMQRVMNHTGGVVRPVPIVQNLRVIGKHFRQGRQEDAHEFLRYFVDGLQKSSLQGLPGKIDPHSKATTVVHQVFGGYHCSQVRCTKCMKTSETFDPLLDLSLDIKSCNSLLQALQKFTKPDLLDGENQYACPFCKEMTPARKRFTIHRLPNVLTIQLKRFDYNSMFGGKINKPVSYPQHMDMRPFMTEKKGPPEWYQLYGVLVHLGFSCRSGHYYCYVRNSNKVWYCLNDSQVHQVSVNQVLQQEAYLLFYIQDPGYSPPSATEKQNLQQQKPATANKIRQDPTFLGALVKRPPGMDKTGTPLVKHTKPTGIVPPSPQTAASNTHTPVYSKSSLSPSIPLRKCDVPVKAAEKVVSTATPTATPQKPTTIPVVKPLFTPRVIAAPSSTRKLQLHKNSGAKEAKHGGTGAKVHVHVDSVAPEEPSQSVCALAREEDVTEKAMETGGTAPVPSNERTILDVAELRIDEKMFLSNSQGPGASQGRFIGPVLPPDLQQLPPSLDSAPLTPSKSPKVARVKPQPKQAKPVALVHPVVLETIPAQQDTKEAGLTSRPGESKEKKARESAAHSSQPTAAGKTPHTPHMNAISPWKVVETGPPQVPTEYDSEAHGWVEQAHTPTASAGPSSEHRPLPEVRLKIKKKHKRKIIRSDSEQSDAEDSERQRERSGKSGEGSSKYAHAESSEEEERRRKKKHSTKHKGQESRKERSKVPSSDEGEHHRYREHGSAEFKKIKRESRKRSPSPARRHLSCSSADEGSAHVGHEKHHKHSHVRERHKKHSHKEGSKHSHERKEGERHWKQERQRHHSGSDSKAVHKSRYLSPSPDRSKRKRIRSHNSSDSEDDYGRRKSAKWGHRHTPKTRLSSGHSHKHHHSHHKPSREGGGAEKHVREGHGQKRGTDHGKVGKVRHVPEKALSSRPEEGRSEETESHHHRHHHRHHRHDAHHNQHHKHSEREEEKEEEEEEVTEETSRSRSVAKEREKHKRPHSHAERSPSLAGEEDRAQHKKPCLERMDEGEGGRSVAVSVPEVEWDSSLKEGKTVAVCWDGSHSRAVVEALTSHTHNQLGGKVKSWDGGDNTIDSTSVAGEWKRREKDPLDQELDKGKVKSVKKHKDTHFSIKNQFQEFQNKKNAKIGMAQ